MGSARFFLFIFDLFSLDFFFICLFVSFSLIYLLFIFYRQTWYFITYHHFTI